MMSQHACVAAALLVSAAHTGQCMCRQLEPSRPIQVMRHRSFSNETVLFTCKAGFCTSNHADSLMCLAMPLQVSPACTARAFHMWVACAAAAMLLLRHVAGAAVGSVARWMAGHQGLFGAVVTIPD